MTDSLVSQAWISTRRTVRLHDLGRVSYAEAMGWQEEVAGSLRDGGEEAVALLEHPPTYSLGVRARRTELLVTPTELEARGAAIVTADRGGATTFHGPGQLVVYPVLDLRARNLGPTDHVRRLEAVVIEALRRLGIIAERVAGRPGVWTDGAKIASVGVRVRHGVSTHGIALNVSTDLSWFDAILPCGLADVRMTSVEKVLGISPPLFAVKGVVRTAFDTVFASRLMPPEPADPLGIGVLAAAW